MAKIDIISGFLGAGKTTLIKKLIREVFQGQQVVLIENEFGEIGIDGGFLKEAGINITEMNSGCICCSLVGDFAEALRQVVEQFHPDHILIEPSGVGTLSDVRRAVENTGKEADLEIGSLVTVVDVKKARMYMKNFGEFYNNQIASAGTIILSRTQDVSDEKLKEITALIREKNPDAIVVTTPWDDLDGKTIHDAMEQSLSLADQLLMEEESHHHHHDDEDEDEHEHHHHHHHEDEHDHDDDDEDEHHHHHDEDEDEDEHEHEHHHHHDDDEDGHEHHHHHHHHGHDADEIFQSWGAETVKKFSKMEIQEILDKLSASTENEYGVILRAKGMVPAEGGSWIHFDMVPEETEVREGPADYTGRLCVIGAGLKDEKIEELFGV